MTEKLHNNKTDKDFTELESLFITSLVGRLYEEGFTDVIIEDICKDTGKEARSLRGTLSSLVKKGVCSMDVVEQVNMVERGRRIVQIKNTFSFICLEKEFFYLHPTFKVEI